MCWADNTKFCQKLNFLDWRWCACRQVIRRRKIWKTNFVFASLKSMKTGVVSGVGSRSISHRYGSGDPGPHQNVTDLQHWFASSPSPQSKGIRIYKFSAAVPMSGCGLSWIRNSICARSRNPRVSGWYTNRSINPPSSNKYHPLAI